MAKCDHCLLEVTENSAICDGEGSDKKVFCCNGCRGVYRLINEEGLGEFYKKRESTWTPGPPDDLTIDPSAFDEVIKEAGDGIEADIILDGIRCASCIWLIEKILQRTKGVTFARVNYATHRARIRWDPEETDIKNILLRLKSIGYTPKPFVAKEHEERIKKEQRDLLIRFGTAAFFSMQLMLYSVALYAGYFQGIGSGTRLFLQLISLLLTTPVLFYSGMPLIRGSIRGLRNLNFNMDVLIVTGAGSAYVYSIYQISSGGEVYFDTAAMIITLILLGRYIEAGAKGRASEVITGLLSLNPKEARVIRQDTDSRTESADLTSETVFQLVPVSEIKAGDRILIKPGERIPLDGTVTEGASEIDEAMLTGESRPVAKTSGSEVFCGTQNLYGSLIFKVVRTGKETVLSRIIEVVEEAQARRAPVQTLADRIVGIFVPVVLATGFLTALFWMYYGRPPSEAVMTAVSVFVISCPCALGLATPLAILIGTTRGASRGILIKGGDVIERAKNTDTVVLDKTGTITEGRPVLSSYSGIGIPDEEALRLAASLERLSEHSIAKAIVNANGGCEQYAAVNFSALPGKGIKGEINGKPVLAGSKSYVEDEISGTIENTAPPVIVERVRLEESSGATLVYLSYDKKLAGVFMINDETRSEAAGTVASLKDKGYDVAMITGDGSAAALKVGKELGLNEDAIMSRRSPVEKAGAIKVMQQQGRSVIMAGDGINDSPALVQADVGIAMGRATDIALESADIVLMRNDLGLITEAITLSKRTYAIIRQNLFWAFIYNVTVLPLAVAGLLHPIVAAISMTLSSLSVVGNSMRLRRG